MHPDLEKLLELQTRDLLLYEVDQKLLAALDQVATFDGDVVRAQQRVVDATRALETAAKRREEIEAKIEGLRILQERRRQRLEMAKTTRELQALGTELELARSVLAREEAEWFKISETTTEAEKQVAAASEQVEELQAGQAEQREVLAKQVAETEQEKTVAAEVREEASLSLTKSLLLRYDRLRRSRVSAVVVVAMHGAVCGACFTAIPMSRRNQIRTGAILDGCEACGVILFAPDEVA